jgi:hypothetical protein
MPEQASRLIKDLTHIPNIIGGMGLSIAAAQKAFNHDYLDSVERILAMARMMLGEVKGNNTGSPTPVTDANELEKLRQFAGVFRDLLIAMAPPRYQFTETTLTVKLDLAQSMDATVTGGLGFSMGGISLNAAFTVGYAYDYRAAAEVRTVIHAIPADPLAFNRLLDRATQLSDKALELPAGTASVDQALLDKQAAIFEKITAIKPAAKPSATPAAPPPGQ